VSNTSKTPLGTLRELALSVGAVMGLLCISASMCAVFFGVTPLVFRSGSMAPAIDTGSVALARMVPAAELQVGDVVSVDLADGTKITHRITEIVGLVGNSAELVLKGDANDVVDPETYVVTEAQRVFADVPYAGYFVSWLSTPFAWGIGAVLSISLIAIAWQPSERKNERPRHSSGKHVAVASVALVTVTATLIGAGASRAEMTMAATTDTAFARAAVTAATITYRPASFTCSRGGIANPPLLSWPNADPTYSYTLEISPGNMAPIQISASTANPLSYNTGLIQSLLGIGTYTFTLKARVGNFVSSTSRSVTASFLTSVLTECGTQSASPAVAARSAPAASASAPSQPSAELSPPSTSEPARTAATEPGPSAAPTTTTTVPPTTTTTPDPPTTATNIPATTTTTTPPAPAVLSGPVTSPSGASTARVVDLDGSPTLQIVDTAGVVQYSAPATSSEAYGYGVNWSAGDQLWLLGPDQLVRLDASGGSWSRTVVDPAATDEVPAEILALLQ
jgi:signal peptidase I